MYLIQNFKFSENLTASRRKVHRNLERRAWRSASGGERLRRAERSGLFHTTSLTSLYVETIQLRLQTRNVCRKSLPDPCEGPASRVSRRRRARPAISRISPTSFLPLALLAPLLSSNSRHSYVYPRRHRSATDGALLHLGGTITASALVTAWSREVRLGVNEAGDARCLATDGRLGSLRPASAKLRVC